MEPALLALAAKIYARTQTIINTDMNRLKDYYKSFIIYFEEGIAPRMFTASTLMPLLIARANVNSFKP